MNWWWRGDLFIIVNFYLQFSGYGWNIEAILKGNEGEWINEFIHILWFKISQIFLSLIIQCIIESLYEILKISQDRMIQGDEMKDNNCCGVKLQDIRRSQISDLMRFDRNCIHSTINRPIFEILSAVHEMSFKLFWTLLGTKENVSRCIGVSNLVFQISVKMI